MSSRSCYWPDGSVTGSHIVPAENDPSSDHVACCTAGHYFFSNQLCLDNNEMTFYRGGCTDDTWANPACPKYCLDVAAQQCGIWTCNNVNQFACNLVGCGNQSSMFTIIGANIRRNAALDSALSITTSSATSAISPTPTPTPTPTPMSTSTPQASTTNTTSSSPTAALCPSHRGAYVGLSAGLGFPLIITLTALILVVMRPRTQKRADSINDDVVSKSELPCNHPMGELEATPKGSAITSHSISARC